MFRKWLLFLAVFCFGMMAAPAARQTDEYGRWRFVATREMSLRNP